MCCTRLKPYIHLLWPLLVAGMLAMVASAYVLEHFFNAIPCKMCWWQRYVHWAVLGLAVAGTVVPQAAVRRVLAGGLVAAAFAGLYIAGWQVLAQLGWLPFPASCTGGSGALSGAEDLLAAMNTVKIVPCDAEAFELFGLTLAMWNLPVMLGVLASGILLMCKPTKGA